MSFFPVISRAFQGKRVTLSTRRGVQVKLPEDPVLKRYLAKRLTSLWRAAVKEFFIELVKHIQVDTGMSYASVLPLARKVHLATDLLKDLTPRRKPKLGHMTLSGEYTRAATASPETGERYGEVAISQRRHVLEIGLEDNLHFKFKFEIVIFQYDLHEPKWKSVLHAEQAFKRYWKDHITDYVKKTELISWIVQGAIRGYD
jgi:hypothetical protein